MKTNTNIKVDRSPRGFASRNGISPSQTYIEIRAGRLQAKKLGKRTILTERAELAWQDSLPDAVLDDDGRLVAAV